MIYKNEYLNEISFPLGGIGSGSVGLCGNGRFMDWEIFNRPAKGTVNNYASFAVKATDKNGKSYTKFLMGDVTKDLMGQRDVIAMFRGYGFGVSRFTMSGFPHFKNCEFKGEFPVAEIRFTDEDFPGAVVMRAFNPLIPGKADDSSIPAAFFEILYENETGEDLDFTVSFTVSNPYEVSKNTAGKKGKVSYIKLANAGVSEEDRTYGDLTIATDSEDVTAQEYWYRGNWCDGASVYWRELSEQKRLKERAYDENGKEDPCSLAAYATISAGEKKSFRYVLSWNSPYCYNYWSDDEADRDVLWKNYYTKLFADSVASATYSLNEWNRLDEETEKFRSAMFDTTLDEAVVDAASATLSVIKTPTVLRLENGEFYGWEGLHETAGSCEGTCQHVWNYAYALCFLFPDLERSIRDLEFDYSTDEDGGMQFRLKLPLSAKPHTHIPCLDGQMGAVIKTYREWKISGDDVWLKRHFDKVMQVLEYAWSDKNICEWDRDKDGVLEGRQHHTLDVELFGPSSWLQGFYLAALAAGAQMAEYLGYHDKAAEYTEVLEKGKKFTKENLFNGKYFMQQVDLKDKEKLEHFGVADYYWNDEINEMKYQIAGGSEIDQLCGQWHANILGLGDLFDKSQVKTALSSMYELNFMKSMRNLANVWRIFALNDESGAIICSYPDGVYKPVIPIPYCEEAMHGFEYQLAGLMISEGMIKEGLEIVRSVRDRYNGAKRNPWNEIECGSNYARSMASFALIPIFAGFTFDMPHKTIGFNPIEKGDFRSIWSLGCGWGTFERTNTETRITINGGALTANKISLPYIKEIKNVTADGATVGYTFENGTLMLETDKIEKELIVEMV